MEQMFGTEDRNQTLRLAEEEVSYWRSQVETVAREIERAAADLSEKERKLRTAQAFLDLMRERCGLRAESEPRGRFEGVGLRDAALKVIEKRQGISVKKLIAELRAGGFQFGEYPARQLHAALIHQDQATRHNDFWRWRATGMKGKEASGQE